MMNVRELVWPTKTGELQNHHIDSTRWNDFVFRDDDIVIGTWAKSGTTWLQQIIGQLIFNGAENIPVMDISAWVDLRILPQDEIVERLEEQRHRRFLKTHLPVHALVFSPDAQYIYIARDGRDVLWSWYNHHGAYSDWAFDILNETPGRIGPPLERAGEDIVQYFHDWLDGDGYPLWPFFSHIRSWWEIRNLPNVLLLHFNDLKADPEGGIRRIADFLNIDVDEDHWPLIVEHTTFDYMRQNADGLTPLLEQFFVGGGRTFVNKGTNSRWRDTLSEEDVRKYEAFAERNLSPDCAHWLATGGMSSKA